MEKLGILVFFMGLLSLTVIAIYGLCSISLTLGITIGSLILMLIGILFTSKK